MKALNFQNDCDQGSTGQSRLVPDRAVRFSGADRDQEKFQNLGADKDREKFRSLGPDQDP